jgi:hypothetical protein
VLHVFPRTPGVLAATGNQLGQYNPLCAVILVGQFLAQCRSLRRSPGCV